MKVLFYNDPHYVFGGTEAYWFDLTHFLRRAGIEVQQLSLPYPDHLTSAFFTQQHIVSAFLRAVEEFKPDVIHLNKNVQYAPSIHKALQILRIPVVASVHDYYTMPFGTNIRNRIKQWLYSFRCADNGYIIPSRVYFDLLTEKKIPNIYHIPHCIDAGQWTFNDNYAVDARHLLYAGRLENQKGIFVLLRAFAILLKKDPGLHLTILGDGKEKANVKRIIIHEHLEQNVTMAGEKPRNEMLRHVHDATLLVMPSIRDEMFGLIGLEAQAGGLPVLASNLPGMSEWCRHGETGWTVPPGDVGRLAIAIEYLLQHPGIREDLRKHARQQVINKFPVAHSIQSLIRLYMELSGILSTQAANSHALTLTPASGLKPSSISV